MKEIKYKGIKEPDKPFRIALLKQLVKELNNLPDGIYDIIVKRWYRKATHRQFKYLYGIVYPKSWELLLDAGYDFSTIEQVDFFWKDLFANKEVVNKEQGQIMKLPLSKSEFITIDELTYCNLIRDYCAEYFNTYIPDPDPNWKLHKIASDEV